MQTYSVNTLLQKTPTELADILSDNFGLEAPGAIHSQDDMNSAADMLARLANEYSFLLELLSFAKIDCRETKRIQDKVAYENAVDRKEIISNKVDAVKNQYAAISRAVTIKIENNNELKMLGNV